MSNFDVLGLAARVIVTIGLGSALCACVSGVDVQAQQQRDIAARRTVILNQPLYVETRMRLLEITQLATSSVATVDPSAEFWVVKTQPNGAYIPVAPVSLGVKIDGTTNREAVAVVGGRRVPIFASEKVDVQICSTRSTTVTCNSVLRVMGRVLANAQGPIETPAFGQLDYSVVDLIENQTFTDPLRIAAATAHMQGVVQQDRRAVAQANAAAPERARLARQREEAHRIAAFKKPSVGSVEFCESVMLLSPGYPVNSGTLSSCEQGKATLGDLRAYGWEVTSMSRRSDTDGIGRRADNVSITIRKIQKVG